MSVDLNISDGSEAPVNALGIEGIEDARVDWDEFIKQTRSLLNLTLAPRSTAYKLKQPDEEWKRLILEHYRRELEKLPRPRVILSHSFGTHLALLLAQEPGIEVDGMILESPPANTYTRLSAPERSGEPKNAVDQILRPFAFDMDPEMYDAFIERHAQDAQSLLHRRRVGQEIRMLAAETPFERKIKGYQGTAPLLAITTPNEGWHVDLPPHALLEVHELEQTGHWAHLSKAPQVSAIVSSWIRHCIHANHHSPVAVG